MLDGNLPEALAACDRRLPLVGEAYRIYGMSLPAAVCARRFNRLLIPGVDAPFDNILKVTWKSDPDAVEKARAGSDGQN